MKIRAMSRSRSYIGGVGLREDKKEALRTQLCSAALELIATQGFEATTIDQIAGAVNTSPRTFIRYYPSKEDVVVSSIECTFRAMVEDFKGRPRGASPIQDLLAAIRDGLKRCQSDERFLMMERVALDSPSVMARKLTRMEWMITEINAELTKRSSKAKLRVPADVVTRVVCGVMASTIIAWVKKDGRGNLRDAFDANIGLIKEIVWQP